MNPATAWHTYPDQAAKPVFLTPVISQQTGEPTQKARDVACAVQLPNEALGLQLVGAMLDLWAALRLATWIMRNFGPGSCLVVKGEVIPLTDDVAARLRALSQKVV